MKRILALFTMEVTSGDHPIEASFLVDVTATNAPDQGLLGEHLDMDEFQLNLECEYGVHDFASFGELDNDEMTLIHLGYDSYEVKEERLDELMGKWTTEFGRLLGADKVSNVHKGEGGKRDPDLESLYNRLIPFLAFKS